MNWTPQQISAINERGENILVSAAAGSGKTAVLANRVAEFIKTGGSCSRLLVVTFTRLAAREMKDRIINILDSLENPSDHIKEQKLMLHSAKISTIDRFFGDIVRSNCKDFDISPDFGIIDNIEYNYIKTKAITEIIEEYRLTYKNGYERLEKIFGGSVDDGNLIRTVDSLYGFMQSIPFGNKWAELCEKRYESVKDWTDAVCEEFLYILEDYISVYEEVMAELPFNDNGMSVVEEEYFVLKKLYGHAKAGDWDSCCKDSCYNFRKSPNCSKDSRIMQKYKLFRNEFKEFLSSEIFLIDTGKSQEDALYLKDAVHCLFCMVKDYDDKIFGAMKRKGSFSFDAISQMALKLVISDYDPQSGEFTTTESAARLAADFDEILIDEYQDVNDLQDLFFSAISENNCFCVGDLKQSIYRFRHANPKNFVNKLSDFRNIPLNMNFRSRSGILQFSNFVFSQLFSKKIGDTDYEKNEYLNSGAQYSENSDSEVEVDYLTYIKNAKEDDSELQARFVAYKIKNMIQSGKKIGGSGNERSVSFGDFAVLLRKFSGILPVYERVFYEEGIPFYSKSGGAFIDSTEVNTVLAYLKVIDNPYDDTALFAVMYSLLYEISADKISLLRSCSSAGAKGKLYDALSELAQTDSDFELFFSDLKHLRLRSVGFPVYTLIWDIFMKTSYLSKVLALPLGDIKRNRLMSFYSFARNYGDRTGGGTLGEFIEFAEKTIESGKLSDSESMPNGNFVKILTIHSSKGLEFPICIVPELEKKIDTKAFLDPIFIDEKFGISADKFSEGFEYKQTTLMKELMKMRLKRTNMSENLRLLYVAFTRAREKLVLVSPGNSVSKKNIDKAALLSNGSKIYRSQVNNAVNFETLITDVLCRHQNAYNLHSDFCDVLPADFALSVNIFDRESVGVDVLPEKENISLGMTLSFDELDKRFYNKKEITQKKVPVKVSVSDFSEVLDVTKQYSKDYNYNPPSFIERNNLSGAEKGSAVHLYMQLCKLGHGVYSEALRLKQNGLLTSEQYNAVISEAPFIEDFENSELYKIILEAENVFREESFVTLISATEYDSSLPEASTMLIQGSLDMLCEYRDGYVIIDYKTDKLCEKSLLEKYTGQLKLYKFAVEKNYGKPVKKSFIWSFNLSKEIEVK